LDRSEGTLSDDSGKKIGPVPHARDWTKKLLGWSHVGFWSRSWGTWAARCGENSGDGNDNEFHILIRWFV
jgi:hypothetical protein